MKTRELIEGPLIEMGMKLKGQKKDKLPGISMGNDFIKLLSLQR